MIQLGIKRSGYKYLVQYCSVKLDTLFIYLNKFYTPLMVHLGFGSLITDIVYFSSSSYTKPNHLDLSITESSYRQGTW